jgi:tRNA dimethylallyltransferase
LKVVAIFGPTAVGKTGVAIALAQRLRDRGEEPVAVNCDSIQVYRGLERLSDAATPEEQEELEHRLLGIAPTHEEFSAGRYAALAHREIDGLVREGRCPLVVGGTGLYLRAALAELELRPPVPALVRAEVEHDLEARGTEALHAELPEELASGVHPNDRKRVARLTELTRLGIAPHASSEGLWTQRTRHPTTLVGLTMQPEELQRRIDDRVDSMVALGAASEVADAVRSGASRTAQAAIGFRELQAGDVAAMKRAQRAYARRQLTWMRRMADVVTIDRTTKSVDEVAAEVLALVPPDAG